MPSGGIPQGVLGGFGHLGVAFMGDAMGGVSAIVVVLALDAIVALAGAVVAFWWTLLGAVLMAVAGWALWFRSFGRPGSRSEWQPCSLARGLPP